MKSKQFKWNSADTKAFLEDALRVLAPYLLVIIPVLITNLPKDWAYSAVVVYLLQRARSAIVLFNSGKK